MWVSHETIQSLFVQGRGALGLSSIAACGPGGPAVDRPAGPRPSVTSGTWSCSASDRPRSRTGRARPLEGDLIIGKATRSAIGTLVERRTRYVLLFRLPDGRTAEAVRTALDEHHPAGFPRNSASASPGIAAQRCTSTSGSPSTPASSSTLSDSHEPLAAGQTTGTVIRPPSLRSPQPLAAAATRSTTGLLRSTRRTVHSQAELDAVARQLNGRPRQTLGR